MARLVRPQHLFLISLVLGWIFDFLFWGKMVGISLPIFTVLIVGAGLWWADRAGLKPSPRALLLLVPIAFFSLVPVFRLEPFTRFTSMVMLIVLLALFALSFLGGQWTRYGYLDYVAKILGLVPNGLVLLRQPVTKTPKKKPTGFTWRSLLPVLRGLLFALPLLWFLAILLASADPAFEEWLNSVFSFIQIENAVEYMARGFIVLILAYVTAAAYLFAFNRSRKQELIGEEKPIVPFMLGFGEAATMLVAVNVLFLAFVVFQFNYFFGGVTNIISTETGFVYSEYAVRGFWELVVVSMTSLGFFIVLSAVSKRETISRQRWFSGFGITLFALVAVILASAFERLFLYERVFGFTPIRTYTHIFMVWLGILLLAVVVLEALKRQRAFAFATLLAAMAFFTTLAVMNVDALIVHSNVGLLREGQLAGSEGIGGVREIWSFDFAYLSQLSDDAVPALLTEYQRSAEDGDLDLAEKVAAALSCHFYGVEKETPQTWQSLNVSRIRAREIWDRIVVDQEFPIVQINEDNTFILHDEQYSCYGRLWDYMR
jgi:hypothetical protein